MATTRLSTKGQLVIPAEVRADLRVEAGSRIELVKTDAGWLLRPATKPISALAGFIAKPRRPVSVEDMNAAIRKRAGRAGR